MRNIGILTSESIRIYDCAKWDSYDPEILPGPEASDAYHLTNVLSQDIVFQVHSVALLSAREVGVLNSVWNNRNLKLSTIQVSHSQANTIHRNAAPGHQQSIPGFRKGNPEIMAALLFFDGFD